MTGRVVVEGVPTSDGLGAFNCAQGINAGAEGGALRRIQIALQPGKNTVCTSMIFPFDSGSIRSVSLQPAYEAGSRRSLR